MTLLGMPARRPRPGIAYDMPRDLYDPTDTKDHPVLVVALDEVRREALVVTRTSKPHARGPRPVAHAAEPDLGLGLPGWWRLHRRHRVPFTHFNDPDVEVLGAIEVETWERVQATLFGTEDGA